MCRTFDDIEVAEVALKVSIDGLFPHPVGSSCCHPQERYLSSSHCWKIPAQAFPQGSGWFLLVFV